MDDPNSQLDPQAVMLAKAVRQTETGGDFNAKGGSGEWGGYQFTQPTWQKLNQKYGTAYQFGNATPEQQNELAYKQIKEWKDKGYNVGQISSMWNAGEGKPNAYLENFRGTNAQGVKYDTPAYAKSVATAYQQLKQGQSVGIDPNNPSSTLGTQKSNPYGATFAAAPNDNIISGTAKAIGNIPSSALNLGKNIANTFLHPIKTLENIGGALSGGVEKALDVTGATQALGGRPTDTNEKQQFSGVMQGLYDRYGSLDNIRKTAENDPVGLALDVSAALQGGGALLKGAGRISQAGELAELTAELPEAERVSALANASKYPFSSLGQVGQDIGALGSAINPINIAGKGVSYVGNKIKDFAGGMTDYMLGQQGGVQSSTIAKTFENPDEITMDAVSTADEGRTNLGNIIKEGLDENSAESSETGRMYSDFRKGTTPVKVDPNFLADQIQKTTGLNMTDEGLFETNPDASVYKASDVSKVNDFYNRWQPIFDEGQMTPNQFLNMRGQLADLAKYEGIGKSSELDLAAMGTRKALNSEYRLQIPGMEDTDSLASYQIQRDQQLAKGILEANGDLKPSAINKIANATGKGKQALLDQLEAISPGITEKIGIQKALEDWQSAAQGIKVGTYGRSAEILTGALAGGSAGPVGTVVGGLMATALTSPSILINAIRTFGKLSNISSSVINGIISKIGSATSLSPSELTILGGAITQLNEGTKNKITPPPSAFAPPIMVNSNQAADQALQDVQEEPNKPDIEVDTNNLQISLPSGKVYKFPTLEALNAFKREVGL